MIQKQRIPNERSVLSLAGGESGLRSLSTGGGEGEWRHEEDENEKVTRDRPGHTYLIRRDVIRMLLVSLGFTLSTIQHFYRRISDGHVGFKPLVEVRLTLVVKIAYLVSLVPRGSGLPRSK